MWRTITQRIPPPPVTENKQHRNDDPSIAFTTSGEPDATDVNSQPGGLPRVRMSCGHAVDPNTLTAWCRDKLAKQEFRFCCPAVVLTENDKPKRCNREWEYAEVRKVALLTTDECRYFETKMSENASVIQFDMKECPGCHSFVERKDWGNLRVVCPVCSRKKGQYYEFCWQCLKEWSGPRRSSTKCGRPLCEHPDLPAIRNSPFFNLSGVQVPLRRACPVCGKVVVHSQDDSRYTVCPRCEREFCFICLELEKNDLCTKPVAPKQTSIPVWCVH